MTDATSMSLDALAESIFTVRFETMPVWVADGQLAWLDDRDGVMHLFTGEPGSAGGTQRTSGTERIQSLHAASGSGSVLVGTDAGGNERQQLMLIDLGTGERSMLTTQPDRMHEPFLVSGDGASALYRTNDGASGEFSLYRVDLASRESTCIWFDAGQVRTHAIDADGRILASLLTSNLDADLYLILPDGTRRPILQTIEESWVVDAAFTANGTRALVLTNATGEFVELVSIDLDTGAMETVVSAGADIEAMSLSPDGQAIAWSVNRDGYSVVHVATMDNVGSPTIAELPDGVVDRLSWSPDSEIVALGWTPVDGPSRIQLVKRDGTVTPAGVSTLDKGNVTGVGPELISFTTFDGREIPAFWYQHADAEAPVVIDVHGGPEGQRRPAYLPVLQFLAAAGFHVLTTNVRGSTGYGKSYSHLDDVELRMDSVRDLASAHEWVLERLGGIDVQVAVMGQSYGGFMTLAAITEYPELWYAAVDVVGIANFVTFLERTGDWRRRHRSAEYGSLENHRSLLERISPIRKVDEIAVPLLVIHGRNDPRVPLFEAEQLVDSLQRRDHPVELMVFDNEGHGLSKRPNRIAGYARAARFLKEMASTPARDRQ